MTQRIHGTESAQGKNTSPPGLLPLLQKVITTGRRQLFRIRGLPAAFVPRAGATKPTGADYTPTLWEPEKIPCESVLSRF
jgi:hypothetical protein